MKYLRWLNHNKNPQSAAAADFSAGPSGSALLHLDLQHAAGGDGTAPGSLDLLDEKKWLVVK